MQKQILNKLIDLYEQNVMTGNFSEIVLSTDTIPSYFEEANFRFRTQFNKEAKALEQNLAISLLWQKPYQSQRLEKLTLNEEHVAKIYRELNRIPKVKNQNLMLQTLKPFANEVNMIGFIATDLMIKISQNKQLFQALRIASTQDIYDAFISMNALVSNEEVMTKESLSVKLFSDAYRISEVEYIIKPLFLRYGVINVPDEQMYLSKFNIKLLDHYVHMKGTGVFSLLHTTIDLNEWPNDFVLNTKNIQQIKWLPNKIERIIIANNQTQFLEYEAKRDLVLYCPESILTPQWIYTHLQLFAEDVLPIIKLPN